MLYLGNNISGSAPVKTDAPGQSEQRLSVEKVEKNIALFDEIKTISRRSIHYTEFCADLANSADPGMIDYLTSVLQGGLKNLSDSTVNEENTAFLQNSVKGLATNFQEAAISAKYSVQRKAEAEQVQHQQYVAAANEQQGRGHNNKAYQQYDYEVKQTLDHAITEVKTYTDYDKNNFIGSKDKGHDKHYIPELAEDNIFDKIVENGEIKDIPPEAPKDIPAKTTVNALKEPPAIPDAPKVTTEAPKITTLKKD